MAPVPARSPHPLDDETEAVVVLAAVGVVALVYGLFAGATLLATAITTHHWPHIAASEHLRAIVRYPTHPGDPTRGYRTVRPGTLASPVAWWTTEVVLQLVVTVVAIVIGRRVIGPRRPAGRWATRRDLRHLGRRRSDHRILLGERHGRPVAVEQRHSVLVVGATQTNKTTGLAIPAILEADQMAVIAISVKDDLVSDTIGWRSTLPGRHWVFDPTNVLHRSTTDSEPGDAGDETRRALLRRRLVCSGWSPLASTVSWQGALATAFDLTRAGSSADASSDSDNKFFYDSAETLLACYLYAAANMPGATMRTVVQWVAHHEHDHVEAILSGLDSSEAAGHFAGVWLDDRKTLSNIFATARLLIGAWLDPNVAASSERSDITPAAFLDGAPNSLYLVAPASNQDRLRVVFNMVVKQFVDAAYAYVLATGRPLARRVLVIVDELANIAPIPNLGGIASTAASQGLQLVSIIQDLSQLRSRYGADDAGTIVNNHRALLILAGVKDVATLELASKLLGSTERSQLSTSRDGFGRRSRTETSRETALAAIEDLRQQRAGHGTLIYGNVRGAELQLRPWFTDRHLARRARHLPKGTGPLNPLPGDTPDRVQVNDETRSDHA